MTHAPQTPLKQLPMLRTDRLILRGFVAADGAKLDTLLSDPAISRGSPWIPYPLDQNEAGKWISARQEAFEKGQETSFAVFQKEGSKLVGAVSLHLENPHGRAELMMWIGRPHRNQGFATEATRSLIRFGFENLRLNRIYALAVAAAPDAGRVLKKLGMRKEGTLRQHVRFTEGWQDALVFGIIRPEFWVLQFTDPSVKDEDEDEAPAVPAADPPGETRDKAQAESTKETTAAAAPTSAPLPDPNSKQNPKPRVAPERTTDSPKIESS